jgi:cysteine-rich repeat protein
MTTRAATGSRRSLLLILSLVCLIANPGHAASSRDYPGPCTGETNASGVPLYLSADYRGTNPVFGVVILGSPGRFKLGISCVATGFVVVRVGPESALCTVRGLCTPSQLLGLTPSDVEAVRFIPNEVPFFHICQKHGFGWYDATNVPAGIYVAAAQSVSALWGLAEGHGTMDTYAFTGNGGAFQQVNCARPVIPVCGNYVVEAGETCDDGNRLDGDCCSSTCTSDAAGTGCPGNGDLCTPGVCNGGGFCLHQNACVDEPIDGARLKLQRRNGKEKLLWRAKNATPVTSGGVFDPTITGATLEMFSPNAAPVTMALAASGWTARGPGVFKFRDSTAASGVRLASMTRGRSVKITGRSVGFPLTGTGPLTGVGLRLVGGTLATCSFFPASSVVIDAPDRFEARGPTPVLASCDRVTLGLGVPAAGGGDLNPGLPPDDPGDPGGGFCRDEMICPIDPILQ